MIFSNLWRPTLTIALLVSIASCGAQTSNEVETVATLEVADSESTETGALALSLVEVAKLDQPVDAASRFGDAAVY
ncbi:MAG: hypothetical protein ACKODR_03680, partial [Acidimicrobiaceae bacterium]